MNQLSPPQASSEAVAAQEWYHTLELEPGVLTPGWFDTRPVVRKLPFPQSLRGKRCLDIGTFDGFWAFEMERRGAAQVLAIDVNDPQRWDWPPLSPPEVVERLQDRKRGGAGFQLAHQMLGSQAEYRELSVYDLDPEVLGEFDFIYLGSLLLHLRDPVAALDRVRRVCDGELLIVENYSPSLSWIAPVTPLARLDGQGRPWWWEANARCVRQLLESAGFEPVGRPTRFRMPAGRGQNRPRLRPSTLTSREQRRNLRNAMIGDPHLAMLAVPRGSTR